MRNKNLLILLLIMLIMPIRVFAAAGFNLSSANITMYPGESKTIKISSSDSVGRLVISSSNDAVASVSASQVFIDTIGVSKTFTIKANSLGNTIVTVVGSENYGSYSDEKSLEGMTKTINVNVIAKPVDNRSKNNNLKSISIDGYELVKVNNNTYTLVVSNDVTSIKVNALAEDAKAKVSGVGFYDLKVGENTINVVITAENGLKNNINIKVTRKDGYYLEDLDTLLNDSNINEISIIINSDSKISSALLEKIKSSRKKVKLNYFDENKKLLYSWLIDGNKINDLNDFVTTVGYISENKEKISKLSNYAEGLYVDFSHEGKVPNGTGIKIYVGDKYENNDLLNIYHYSEDKLELIKKDIEVNGGYIEFDIEHCSEYFVTMAILYDNEKTSIDIFKIISILEVVIIVILLCVLLFRKKNKKVKNDSVVSLQQQNESLFVAESVIFPVNN